MVVLKTLGKHPPVRWQQSFSNTSDPLVFPLAFLEYGLKIFVLLAALAVAVASVLAVASLNDLKIQLSIFLRNFVKRKLPYLKLSKCMHEYLNNVIEKKKLNLKKII